MSKVVLNSRIKKMECGGKSIPQEYIVCFNDYIKNVINTRVDQEIAELNKIIAKKFELGKFKSVNELIYAYKSLEKEYTKSRQRIAELEERLKNATKQVRKKVIDEIKENLLKLEPNCIKQPNLYDFNCQEIIDILDRIQGE